MVCIKIARRSSEFGCEWNLSEQLQLLPNAFAEDTDLFAESSWRSRLAMRSCEHRHVAPLLSHRVYLGQ